MQTTLLLCLQTTIEHEDDVHYVKKLLVDYCYARVHCSAVYIT